MLALLTRAVTSEMTTLTVEDVLRVNGSHRFAAALAAASPFSSLAAALLAARRIWRNDVDVPGWLEAFAANPPIGTTSPSIPKWSKEEQSVARSTATHSIAQDLSEWNAKYRNKFGFVFLICATGRTAPEVLAELKRRYANRLIVELEIAAEEELKITELRLAKLFSPETAAPPTSVITQPVKASGMIKDPRKVGEHINEDPDL